MTGALIIVLLAACSRDNALPAGGTARFDTLANGIVRVQNSDPGSWVDAQAWHIVEDLRIGSNEADDPATFSQVTAIGASPAGEIVVADGASQQLRVFDVSGRHIRTVGRKGGGPGEFEGISGIAWDESGVMWVADPGNARYARYDEAGAHLGDVAMRAPGAVLPWLGTLGRDGFLYDAAGRPVGDRVEFRYYRMDRETGDVQDTLPPMVYTPVSMRGVPMALFRLVSRLTFRLSPDGMIWFGETGRYRVFARSLAGDTIREVSLDRPDTRVSSAERDSLVRAIEDEPRPPGFEIDLRDIPARKPAFDRIHFDDSGHVIIEPDGPPQDAGRRFDVFESDGRFLGQARSDVAFETFPALPVFRNGFVYGVASDSTGIQVVVRARIVAASSR